MGVSLAMGAGCGSKTSAQTTQVAQISLDGAYVSTDGPITGITFFDGVRYSLWRSPCANGTRCLEYGTYLLAAGDATLSLHDDVTGETAVLSFAVVTAAPAATTQGVRLLGGTVSLGGGDSGTLTGGGGTLTSGDGGCLTASGIALTPAWPPQLALGSSSPVSFQSAGQTFVAATSGSASNPGAESLAPGENRYSYPAATADAGSGGGDAGSSEAGSDGGAPAASGVPRSQLQVGDNFGPAFNIKIPRYIGSYTPTGSMNGQSTGSAGPELGAYVTMHTLGKFTEMSFSMTNAEGLVFGLMLTNSQTGHGGKTQAAVTMYDPAIAGSAHVPITFAGVGSADGGVATAKVGFPTEELALAIARTYSGDNEFQLVVKGIGCAPGLAANSMATFSGATLDFFAQPPVILLHGIDDNQAHCWPDYVTLLKAAGFKPDMDIDLSGFSDKPPMDGVPCPPLANTCYHNGSVLQDVSRIQERMATVLSDYGTQDVNVVVHSKGGLDFVNFLANVGSGNTYSTLKAAHKLRVVTLQTLSTPHGGSVFGDINEPLETAMTTLPGSPGKARVAEWTLTETGASDVLNTGTLTGIKYTVSVGSGPIDPGISDLRTTSVAVATDLAWSPDKDLAFKAYGWNADFNRNEWVSPLDHDAAPPSSVDANANASVVFKDYSSDCRGNPLGSSAWSADCIDFVEVDTFFDDTVATAYCEASGGYLATESCGVQLWRPMAFGRSAKVTTSHTLGVLNANVVMTTYGGPPTSTAGWEPNDLVVARASALHPHATATFFGDEPTGSPTPRPIPGLHQISSTGAVVPYTATCKHSGGNHIAILREGMSQIVQCTAADTVQWMLGSVPVNDVPNSL